ncbi:hypothetical protein [Chloroflexus aurantiacus]
MWILDSGVLEAQLRLWLSAEQVDAFNGKRLRDSKHVEEHALAMMKIAGQELEHVVT